MAFCPQDKCPHYTQATKYPRKCYYEPQCWRGFLDILIALIRMRFSKDSGKTGGTANEEDTIIRASNSGI